MKVCESNPMDQLMAIPDPDPRELLEGIERANEGLRRSYIYMEALELDLFEITIEPVSAATIATRCGLNEDMAELFCEALHYMGLLDAYDGKYVNSPAASTYLVRASPYCQRISLERMGRSLKRWQNLTTILREGPELVRRENFFNEGWITSIAERVLCGEVRKVVEQVFQTVDLGGKRKFLDLGGGHGLYAATFLAFNPELDASVFDMPNIVPITRRYLAEHGASSIKILAGDFTKDPIGNDYDIIFSSFNPSGSDVRLIPKIRDALLEGGVFVNRQFTESARSDAVKNLEWNFTTFEEDGKIGRRFSGPHTSSLDEYTDALISSGFELIRRWPVDDMSEIVAVTRTG